MLAHHTMDSLPTFVVGHLRHRASVDQADVCPFTFPYGLHSEFTELNRGITEKVLFESKEKDGSMGGYTGNYIRITRPYDPALVGVLTDIII